MEPALIGTRLASAAIRPILKKLLVSDGPGAGLTGNAPKVRLSGLVSFRGEKRTLTEKDVRKLATTLVERSRGEHGETPFPADETEAVAHTLGTTLLALGDLDMDDVHAVRLGHRELARRLRAAAPAPDGLAADSVLYLESMTEWACLHILEFFTQRSTFIARSMVEQTRGQTELIAKIDELVRRTPRADGRDAEFERRYLAHLAKRHGRLTIYGIDLHDSPDRWPLDLAYLSLEATGESPFALIDEAGDLVPQQWEQAVRADLALARHDKVLLRGLAGSGKTTLVQWLTVSTASEGRAEGMAYLRDRIPFVLPLRALTRHGERLPAPDRFLPAAGCPLTPPEGWVDRVLASGRGVVLVDGIDEIPEAERGRARDWLRGLLDTYEGNRWLVTSRPTAVRDDWLAPEGFTELTLSPMTGAEVTTFVRRWHRAAGPEAEPYEQPLLDALRTAEHVAQLATNPLMCGLICALHRDRRGFLPRGRKALYEAALSMLLSRRDRERDMGAPSGLVLDEAPQIQLIQRLAYWLTLNGRTTLDRAHAESIVAEAVPAVQEASAHAPDAVFTHLLHRSGLLREPTADTVEFVHRTFQDYLAAKALVDRWDIGVLVQHAADDQWEDVLRMAVGHARPRECAEILRELLAAADTAEDRRVRLRLVILAATAMDHATEVPPEIREQVLARAADVIPPRTSDEARELGKAGRLVLDLLPGPEGLSEVEARLVVTAGTHVEADAAIPYLARFAGHPSLEVRSQLIWGWGRFEAAPYAEAIVARLDPDELRYSVVDDERARELLRLRVLPEALDVHGTVSDAQLATLLTHCDPRALELRRDDVRPDLTAVAALTRLEFLNLHLHDGADWRVADLPEYGALRHLSFNTWPADGLASLSRFPRLAQLALLGTNLTERRWHQVAELKGPLTVVVRAADLLACPDGMRLPGIEGLVVQAHMVKRPSLSRLARFFPALRSLVLYSSAQEPLDVSRLAAFPHLTRFTAPGLALTGTEHLSPTIQIGT
ncbi:MULTISPECIES: NACHT domain-containing protein [Streptomyces]|uniref:ATP-binding protein n=1 Tax=Streptomyces venezuelae TaxID=54571 RepID=A0A5P2AVC2_STRVZ|nr:NACHT domain-containing protein [Streptomyces venezuelae]QES21498.1 ATP-binding protein [Streptomyces venezuelae]